MPKLPTYTAQFGGLPTSGGRRAEAPDFGGGTAAAAGDAARATQKVGESMLTHVEETESRRALVGTTEIRAKYARELDQAIQTGADTEEIKARLDADLAKVGEEFQTAKGQASLDMYSANTYLMFDEQANRIEVQRAAATARMEAQKYMQSSSAILVDNPFYLAEAERGVDDLMATFRRLSPQQRAEMSQDLKQNLNMAAVMSAARVDPEGTRRKLEAGQWTLAPEQRETAINKTEVQINARRAAENHARAQAEFERRQRDEKATHGYVNQIIRGTLTGRALENAITTDPDLDSQSVRILTSFATQRANELKAQAVKTDPVVERELFMRIYAPDSDPRKIINADAVLKAVADGKMSTDDGAKYVNAIRAQKDENNRSIGATLYTMSSSFQRSLEQNYHNLGLKFAGQVPAVVNEFTSMAQERVSAARDANDVTALRDLFNPKSKTYIGSAEFMQEAINRVKARHEEEIKTEIPRPLTQKEYDAIPNGTTYIDTDGATKVKGAKALTAPLDLGPSPDGGLSERRAAQRGANEPLLK